MRVLIFSLSILLLSFTSCKKDEVVDNSPSVIGSWEIVQTATTHELGYLDHLDQDAILDKVVNSRVTTTVDHQNQFEVLDISRASMTWTDLQSETKLYNWTFEGNLFTLMGTDTMKYHVTELTYDSFVFFIKDLRPYSDSTKLYAYEEYQYVYHLNKVND
ncbi:MAG: hypothetical protein P8I82_05715 [Flavobacteriales bacterium]|nr:hypothetical protein [Flavobacteriales bacterium]